MKKIFIYLFLIFLIPTTVWGASVMRSGEMVSITTDQVVEGDFYGFGNSVVISGQVNGDLLVAGGSLTMTGQVEEDLMILAGKVDLLGLVNDDARIIASEVVISGEIVDDLVVLARNLKILPTAKVGGDLIFFGNSAEIAGYVGGNINGRSDKIRIDAEVMGEVDVSTHSLVIGDKAKITNGIKYVSANEIIRSPNAQIEGGVVRSDPLSVSSNDIDPTRLVFIVLLITLFASLVWFLLFRGFIQRIVSHTRVNAVRNMLVGFAVLLTAPAVATILIASTLGMLLGVAILLIYLVLIVITFILMGPVLGYFISKLWAKSFDLSIVSIVVGVFALYLSILVPIIGVIVFLGALFVTLGSVTINIYRFLRSG